MKTADLSPEGKWYGQTALGLLAPPVQATEAEWLLLLTVN